MKKSTNLGDHYGTVGEKYKHETVSFSNTSYIYVTIISLMLFKAFSNIFLSKLHLSTLVNYK